MSDTPQIGKQKRLVEFFGGIGLLSPAQIEEGLKAQQDTGQRLSEIFVDLEFMPHEELPAAVYDQLGLSFESLKGVEISEKAMGLVSPTLCYAHKIMPIKAEEGVLTLATNNVFNLLAIQNLEVILKHRIELILTEKADFIWALEKFYGLKEEPVELIVKKLGEEDELITKQEFEEKISVEEAPLIRLVSLLIVEAVKSRASDIHLEPLEKVFRVRYRIDGVLHEVPGPPKRLQGSVISRIKLMAGMDIAEKRLPQDGRIRIKLHGKDLDLRVSTLPAVYGESLVMRILDKSSFMLGLNELGFQDYEIAKFEKLLQLPNGIVLDTGPTGSGKTTTLYAALHYINKPGIKVITIEDPVEYQITGVNQVQVKPQIGLTFAAGLRSMLRQAPDVIMVGEIRDYEAAQIAIQAALTGHFVLSTLHTNDASGAITRLIDMGIKPYLVASSVQAVLAQRLVRVICEKCKEAYNPSVEELLLLGLTGEKAQGLTLYRGKGCDRCGKTGYFGRISLFEILVMSDNMRDLIFKRVSSKLIQEAARGEGMKILKEDGIAKVLKGVTTTREVLRVVEHGIE